MPRCLACCRMARALHGDYGLCRSCNRRLEADISAWVGKLSSDIDRMVAFDSYCADRAESVGRRNRTDPQRGAVDIPVEGGDPQPS